MILWFKNLPATDTDFSSWLPFIGKPWFRTHYMKFVYLLMISIALAPGLVFGVDLISQLITETNPVFISTSSSVVFYITLILFSACTFVIHEFFHIIVIYKLGDISLTFSGIFFWLNTDTPLSKKRFWLFMSLPLMMLSIVPAFASIGMSGFMKSLMLYICWFNMVISSSDIINSFLILIKPKNSIFCRGYYRLQ